MTQTIERAASMDQAKIAEILEKLKDSPMVRGEIPTAVTNARTISETRTKTTTESSATPTPASATAGVNTRAASNQINSYTVPNGSLHVQQDCYVYYLRTGTWLHRNFTPYYSGKEAEYLYYFAGTVNITTLFYKLCELDNRGGYNKLVTDFKIRHKVNRPCRYHIYTLSGNRFTEEPLSTVNNYIEIPYMDMLKAGEDLYFIYVLDDLLVEFVTEGADATLIDMDYTTAWKLDFYNQKYQTDCDCEELESNPMHEFDIHYPRYLIANPPYPAILTIHGGNWTGGDRSDFYPYIDRILEQSCVHINMNYHLINTDSNNGNPTLEDMLDDIEAVIKAIKNNTATDGYIDKTKLALMGWSAGGHLALMYACKRDDWDNEELIPIRLVISEAGPTCLHSYDPEDKSNSEKDDYRIPANSDWLGICARLRGIPLNGLTTNDVRLQDISPKDKISNIEEDQRILQIYSLYDITVIPAHAKLLKDEIHTHFPTKDILHMVELNIIPTNIKDGYHNEFAGAYAASSAYQAAWASEISRYKNIVVN